MLKLALKLLMVMAIFMTVTGLSGWKWTTNTTMLRAADYSLVQTPTDGSAAISPAADMSVTPVASASVPGRERISITPDANASVTPDASASVTPDASASTDGWTWD